MFPSLTKEEEQRYREYQSLVDQYNEIFFPTSQFHDYCHSCWYLGMFTFCLRFNPQTGVERFWVDRTNHDDVYSGDQSKWLTLDDVLWNLELRYAQMIYDGWELFR